jgi:hypothetical protein
MATPTEDKMAKTKLFKSVLGAIALSGFIAASAQAVVVQYNGNLGFGFGDFSAGDTANNAIPPCSPKSATSMGSTTTGSVNFVGQASVIPGSAPQAVKFFAQAGPLGLAVTCPEAIQTGFGVVFTRRTQRATFVWPASTGTVSAGGGFGATSPPFKWSAPWAPTAQTVTVMAKATKPRFGGAVRMAGRADAILGINAGALGVFVGTLPVTLGVGGEGGPATPTLTIMGANPFYRQLSPPLPLGCVPFRTCTVPGVTPGFQGQPGTPSTFPFLANGGNFPWTTGTIRVFDTLGNFTTTRTRTGADNRTPSGLFGVLQLVSPSMTLITGLAPIGFAPTAELTLEFTPEPAATALLASGGLALVGLYSLHRRRR